MDYYEADYAVEGKENIFCSPFTAENDEIAISKAKGEVMEDGRKWFAKGLNRGVEVKTYLQKVCKTQANFKGKRVQIFP